ncbi:MAG: hypothetical protein M3Z26_17515 [Bacteroidota bacterium]|nr:hypothetical protein [Bacteroidota bacterium]
MKKVNSLIYKFCIPEKRCCFWVRAVMQTMKLKLRTQRNRQPDIYVAALKKTTENTLLQ